MKICPYENKDCPICNKEEFCGVIIQHTIAGPIRCAEKRPCWMHDKKEDRDSSKDETDAVDLQN